MNMEQYKRVQLYKEEGLTQAEAIERVKKDDELLHSLYIQFSTRKD